MSSVLKDEQGNELVITSTEFGEGKKFHKPDKENNGIPACQNMFSQGTRLALRDKAEMDGLKPCQHPACFGGDNHE